MKRSVVLTVMIVNMFMVLSVRAECYKNKQAREFRFNLTAAGIGAALGDCAMAKYRKTPSSPICSGVLTVVFASMFNAYMDLKKA